MLFRSGGDGHDTFSFTLGDVMPAGVYQGMDVITDFASTKTLDLHDFTHGNLANIDDVVHINWHEGEANSVLSVKIGDAFVDVALLVGVEGGSAKAWAYDGMILA